MDASVLRVPSDDGEIAVEPPFGEWEVLARQNRERAASWEFDVAGIPVRRFRSLAREQALQAARDVSARLGVPVRETRGSDPLVVMTGHQPILYHPGVWAKAFLADRMGRECGALAVECVVDTDGFDRVALTAPCGAEPTGRCTVDLARGGEDSYFSAAPVPTEDEVTSFRARGASILEGLGLPDVVERFAGFCDDLAVSRATARDLSELVTVARRRYERPAETGYLELPVSAEGRTPAFLAFLAAIAWEASRFREVHDAVLADLRAEHGIRSAARPFPDLRADGDLVEIPFWHLDGSTRSRVWARRVGGGAEVHVRGAVVDHVTPDDDGAAVLSRAEGSFAPRAVTMTMFNRLFVTDLFVHGAGGSSYDRVTDAIVRVLFGVEPPAYVSATLTARLPLGPDASALDERIAGLRQRLHAIAHNPDRLLEGYRPAGRDGDGLVAEKARLIEAIGAVDADRKALGARIREVNRAMEGLLAPLAEETRAEIDQLVSRRERAAILADRTYPFCLWDAVGIRDMLG